MSDIGLHESLYQPTRTFAKLIDTVLIELKSDSFKQENSQCKKLGDLLIELSSNSPTNHSTRLLSLMLRGIIDIDKKKLLKVGQILNSVSSNNETISLLEKLARSLEQELVRSASRIRGLN